MLTNTWFVYLDKLYITLFSIKVDIVSVGDKNRPLDVIVRNVESDSSIFLYSYSFNHLCGSHKILDVCSSGKCHIHDWLTSLN